MAQSLRELILSGATLADVVAFSQALSPDARGAEVRTLNRRALKRLWALTDSSQAPAQLSMLLPPSTPAGHTVDWVGRNSLPPGFNNFSKRFTRSADPAALTGHNTGFWKAFQGPGYFTAVARPGVPTELLLDYTRYPPEAPAGWPTLKSNSRWISYFVFHDMHDYVRPVGEHLAIGAAHNSKGKSRHQYFAIARGETLPIGT